MQGETDIETINYIKTHIDSWQSLKPHEIKFERLGGLSNEMWKVISLNASVFPEAVIFRKFGAGSGLVDREKENYILTELAQQGVGPKFYAGTGHYRVEEFYDSNTLTPKEINQVSTRRKMAKAIAELHSTQLSDLDGTPCFLRQLERKNMINQAQEKAQRKIYTPAETEILQQILSLTTKEEISFLKDILPNKPESVVFSHNDIHSQNVLVLKENNQLLLIDYEYSDFNYRGYDIANFFNEAMFDYSNSEYPYYKVDETKFPSDNELREFIQYYLFFSKFKPQSSLSHLILEDHNILSDYVENHYNLSSFMEEVEEILNEVRVCILLSHYHWILWSIIMSKNSEIQFDYLHYAYQRFEIYQNIKRKFYRRRVSYKRAKSQKVL